MTKPLPTDACQRAKRQAWNWLSKALRLEAADDRGNCVCVTCGARQPWQETDAGHWISGRRESILFAEDGIHPQCHKCNRYHHANPWGVTAKKKAVDEAYDAWMLKEYGQGRLDELLKRNQVSKTHSLGELLEMIEGYRLRVKFQKKTKGL